MYNEDLNKLWYNDKDKIRRDCSNENYVWLISNCDNITYIYFTNNITFNMEYVEDEMDYDNITGQHLLSKHNYRFDISCSQGNLKVQNYINNQNLYWVSDSDSDFINSSDSDSD